MTPRRYPFADLERLVPHGMGVKQLAALLGVNPRQIYRWRELGVTAEQAERLAHAVGYHPLEVWPQLLGDVLATMERPCAAPDCDATFVPASYRQRFCTRRCVQRAAMRRYRATHPEQMVKARQRAKAYREDCRAYVAARHRAWEKANRQEINARRRARRAELRGLMEGVAA